jgi:pyruvate formate lyase activating enzyme
VAALRIGGFTPFSTTDYPGQLAAVVFCQGCPWRCAYCHNPHLLPAGGVESHVWQDVLAFLDTRRGLLDAVVFSGGEATAQAALADAVRAVRALGFRVGLHSAGMYPQRLAALLPLLDWVGLDIKAPRAGYARIVNAPADAAAVYDSLRMIRASGVAHEVRTTWHPQLFDAADLRALAGELRAAGVDELVVQEARSIGTTTRLPDIADADRAGLRAVLRDMRRVGHRPAC